MRRLLLVAVTFACSTSSSNLSAEEHRARAAEARAEAAEDDAQFDPQAQAARPSTLRSPDRTFSIETYNPTQRFHDEAARHMAQARAHERAAAELEKYEDEQCGEFTSEVRAACPLLGALTAVDDVPGGARVQLREPRLMEPVAEHIRCHAAFARARGHEDMEGCPMYVKGLRVKIDGDWLVLTSKEPGRADALRAELRTHLVDQE